MMTETDDSEWYEAHNTGNDEQHQLCRKFPGIKRVRIWWGRPDQNPDHGRWTYEVIGTEWDNYGDWHSLDEALELYKSIQRGHGGLWTPTSTLINVS